MVIGFRTSAAAMEGQAERLAVLANNLANVSTTGFKADHVEFIQSLSSPRAAGPLSPGPAAPLSPPVLSRTRTEFSAGPLRETGNALDLAIEGRGFFVVQTPGGVRLTRALVAQAFSFRAEFRVGWMGLEDRAGFDGGLFLFLGFLILCHWDGSFNLLAWPSSYTSRPRQVMAPV